MVSRRIFKNENTGHYVLKELLQSIFIAELVNPSEEIWIVSPWISNVNIIDNRAGDFNSINFDWKGREISLIDILIHFMSLGSNINIVANTEIHSDKFEDQINEKVNEHSFANLFKFVRNKIIHQKGIITKHGSLRGSINITYNGIYINDELITYSIDEAEINQDLIYFNKNY